MGNAIAVRVLQQLIAGTAGDRLQWEMRRKRLATVTKNIKKEIGDKSEKSFSLESVQFRAVGAIPLIPRCPLPADPHPEAARKSCLPYTPR